MVLPKILVLTSTVVDAGGIVMQPQCPVQPGDSPEALKARVQALEAPALADAVRLFAANGQC